MKSKMILNFEQLPTIERLLSNLKNRFLFPSLFIDMHKSMGFHIITEYWIIMTKTKYENKFARGSDESLAQLIPADETTAGRRIILSNALNGQRTVFHGIKYCIFQ